MEVKKKNGDYMGWYQRPSPRDHKQMAYWICEYFSENRFSSSIIEQNKELAIEYSSPHLFILEETSNSLLLFQALSE